MKALAAVLATLVLSGGVANAQQEAVEYYHLDAIGSVRAVSNQANVVIERHDYLPFGEECTTGPCANNPGAGAGQPRKFTSKERDQETGLDYFGARYYGARTARFTTVDPVYTWKDNLEDPQRWNRYAYGRDNPLRFIDPDGKQIRHQPPKLSDETIARNRRIHDAIDAVMKWDPFPQDQAVASEVKEFFPTREPTRLEQMVAAMVTIAGAAAPLEAPVGGAIRAASNATGGLMRSRQLASQGQWDQLMSGGGEVIAGVGHKTPIRDVPRLVAQYGGEASDWAKIKSFNFKGADGVSFETHAYRNVQTGQTVELKTKFQ